MEVANGMHDVSTVVSCAAEEPGDKAMNATHRGGDADTPSEQELADQREAESDSDPVGTKNLIRI